MNNEATFQRIEANLTAGHQTEQTWAPGDYTHCRIKIMLCASNCRAAYRDTVAKTTQVTLLQLTLCYIDQYHTVTHIVTMFCRRYITEAYIFQQ